MDSIFDKIPIDSYAGLESVIDIADTVHVREKLVSIPLSSLMSDKFFASFVGKHNMTVVRNINGISCLLNKNAPIRKFIKDSGIFAYQSANLVFQPIIAEYRTTFYFDMMVIDFGYTLIHDVLSYRETKRPLDINPTIAYIINIVISGVINSYFDVHDDKCSDPDIIVKYLVGISPDNGLLYFDHINVYSRKKKVRKRKTIEYPLTKSAQCILVFTGLVDYSEKLTK